MHIESRPEQVDTPALTPYESAQPTSQGISILTLEDMRQAREATKTDASETSLHECLRDDYETPVTPETPIQDVLCAIFVILMIPIAVFAYCITT